MDQLRHQIHVAKHVTNLVVKVFISAQSIAKDGKHTLAESDGMERILKLINGAFVE